MATSPECCTLSAECQDQLSLSVSVCKMNEIENEEMLSPMSDHIIR